MVCKIIEIADCCGMTGLKRVTFYIVAPFIAVISYIGGFVKGLYEKHKSLNNEKKGSV